MLEHLVLGLLVLPRHDDVAGFSKRIGCDVVLLKMQALRCVSRECGVSSECAVKRMCGEAGEDAAVRACVRA